MGRNVHVKANGGAPVTLTNWEGLTFGDLKAALPDVSFEGQRVQVRGTLGDLVDNGALIPLEGEVIIFCAPAKMNAGSSDYKTNLAYAKEKYHNSEEDKVYFASYNSIKADELEKLVKNHQENNDLSESYQATSEGNTVSDTIASIYCSLGNLVEQLNDKVSSVLGGVSFIQLNQEHQDFVERTKVGK